MDKTYTIDCTGDQLVRAVYYSKDGKPTGSPIMFLMDKGMEAHAEGLVNRANECSFWEEIFIKQQETLFHKHL